MPRKTKSAGGSLGRSLVKSRNKKRANRRTKLADRKARSDHRNAETGQYEDYGGMTGLTSVTELNSLDEFISHARMADRQFATERNQVTVVEDSMIGGSDAALGRASAVGGVGGVGGAVGGAGGVGAAGAAGAGGGALTIENLKVRVPDGGTGHFWEAFTLFWFLGFFSFSFSFSPLCSFFFFFYKGRVCDFLTYSFPLFPFPFPFLCLFVWLV